MKNLKDNKALSILGTVLYDALVVLIVCILAVVLLQRVSNNNFAIGGVRIFNIVSESMVPKYNIGDILVAKSIDPSQIKVGDDISYRGEVDTFKDKIVTHQVIAIDQKDGKYVFQTKGIANDEADPLITQDQVYGKIIYHTVFLSLISKVILNLYGFYFLIFVPLTILILIKIKEILLSIKDGKEEKEDKNEDQEAEEKSDKPEKKEKEDSKVEKTESDDDEKVEAEEAEEKKEDSKTASKAKTVKSTKTAAKAEPKTTKKASTSKKTAAKTTKTTKSAATTAKKTKTTKTKANEKED